MCRRLVLAIALSAAQLVAAEEPPPAPELKSWEPFVLRVGQTNELTLKGDHLKNVQSVWTSRNGIIPADELDVRINNDGTRAHLRHYVDPRTASGPFAIRVITDTGISAPRLGFLESLPELEVAEDQSISGTGFHSGTIKDPAGIEFNVTLKKGETLPIDVIAGQFGSKLDPVLSIRAGNGHEVSYVHDSKGMGVDCHQLFEAPQTDTYSVLIRDARYGSGGAYRYHLRLGTAYSGMASAYVRSEIHNEVLGPSVQARVPDSPAYSEQKQQLIDSELQQKPIALLVASASAGETAPSYRLDAIATYPVATLHHFFESVSEFPFERRALAGSSMNGWFTKPDQVTAVRLRVQEPGTHRWVALSRRLGGHSDPAMRLKTKDGELLAQSDLFQNESVLKHKFDEVGEFVLEIWDLAGQFGEHTHYHIQAQPDPAEFELNTETDSMRIVAGGETDLKVSIARDGYRGPVKFTITTEVEGVTLQDASSEKNAKEAVFKIALSDSLSPGKTFRIKISGSRGDEDDSPRSPLYTQAYWKKQFPDLYSPMFEFEDTIWVTVLPESKTEESKVEAESDSPDEAKP